MTSYSRRPSRPPTCSSHCPWASAPIPNIHKFVWVLPPSRSNPPSPNESHPSPAHDSWIHSKLVPLFSNTNLHSPPFSQIAHQSVFTFAQQNLCFPGETLVHNFHKLHFNKLSQSGPSSLFLPELSKTSVFQESQQPLTPSSAPFILPLSNLVTSCWPYFYQYHQSKIKYICLM